MRSRLLNRLLSIAAAISLLACAAICVVWVRSFYVIENETIVTPTATYEIGSGGGALAVQRVEPGDGDFRWMRPSLRFSVLGLELIEGRLNRRRPWMLLLMPYWVPAGLAAILPMGWILARAHRETTTARRRCPECGHDRDPAHPCPSCGHEAPLTASAKPGSTPSR
jgi:hypothetical protein